MRLLGSLLSVAPAAFCALMVGCAAPVETGVPSASEDAGAVHGFLSVDRTSSWDQEQAGAREVASATFLKVQEGTDPAVVAKLVGAVPDLPVAGTCRALDAGDATSLPLRTLNPVEMVRVGDVTVRSETSTTRLVTRAYPDVAHLVSGVVYTSSGRELPGARGRVAFEVGGAEGVPGFEVDAPMPPSIEKVTLNGVEVSDERDWLALGDAVELSWSATEEDVSLPASVGVSEPDRFFVDLTVINNDQTSSTVRCSGGTSAKLHVPLVLTEQTDSVSITAHRLRTVRLATRSLAGGEVRLDAARSASVKLSEGSDD